MTGQLLIPAPTAPAPEIAGANQQTCLALDKFANP
jgi:hypothetical protein